MSLANGIYIIQTKPQDEKRHVGRFPIEDLSLLPKQLFALPLGVEAPKVRPLYAATIRETS